MNLKSSAHDQRQIGIIGHHLSHTLSPAMHTAAFQELHLDYLYGVMDVEKEWLPALFSALRKHNYRGANVTLPFKKAVIPFIDILSDDADSIGAVNTIVNNNGSLEGYNTDAYGIVQSLKKFKDEITGSNIVIFGAGGAARAVVFALGKYFLPQKITIINRTIENARRLSEDFGLKFPSISFSFKDFDSTQNTIINDALLLINTTSVGMKPNIHQHPLPPDCVIKNTHIVFDIVYNPVQTHLLTMASKMGAQTIQGIEMLLGQGEKAFELFTDQKFPAATAREALLRELR
jgi:shikimate dehydrogenase